MLQNLTLGLSLLTPVYFLLVTGFVLAVETGVFFLFWKNWKLALGVTLLVNVASALLAIPFFLAGFPGYWGSPWLSIINSASLFIIDHESYLIPEFLIFFLPTCGVSMLIEGLLARHLVSPEFKVGVPVVCGNLLTYGVIYGVLLVLGFWFGFTNTDPYVDAIDFFGDKFFFSLSETAPSAPLFDLLYPLFALALFFGFCLTLFLLVWHYYHTTTSVQV